MFTMTVQEWVNKFTQEMESGCLKPDDEIAVEYWTYDDVKCFADGDDYYGEVTDDVAREVFDEVTWRLRKFDGVDNDVMRDTISEVLDERVAK